MASILSVDVAVMRVRIVRMRVGQRLVPVRMAVPRAGRDRHRVLVLVVRVMGVPVRVFERRMRVRVLVPLGQVQPDAERHQPAGDKQRRGERVAEHDRERGAEERRDREIGAGARGAEARAAPRRTASG